MRHEGLYLSDIVEASDHIAEFIAGADFNAFERSELLLRSWRLLDVFLSSLHRGEAEAIALASELKAEIVVIDEQEGRHLATQAGLSVTGVLGVLLRAKLA